MSKDELLKQKEVLQAELNKLEELIKQEDEPAYYIPKMNEIYFYIDDEGKVGYSFWDNAVEDIHRHEFGNCYKIHDEALYARDVQKDLLRLQHLALTLNKGEKIDWKKQSQRKYYLLYDVVTHNIDQYTAISIQGEHTYCLHPSFRGEATKLFGEERLKEILTYQRY